MTRLSTLFAGVLVSAGLAWGQENRDFERVTNWAAPPLWSMPAKVAAPAKEGTTEAAGAIPSAPLSFVGIVPCRVADTRGNGFTGQYGPPQLTGAGRTMVIGGQCGIPANAQAVSFNFHAVNVTAPGFFVAYPAGEAFPPVATMTYNQNTPNISNASVVPLGTGGAIVAVAGVSNIDLIVDVNGYYGDLPIGTSGQTLRHNGTTWVPNSALTSDGTNVAVTGVLNLPFPPEIRAGGPRFLHSLAPGAASSNVYLGFAAGSAASPGDGNIGIGHATLYNATTGSLQNIGIGHQPLYYLTTGDDNIGLGANTLVNVNTGSGNIAIGAGVGSGLSSGSNNLYLASPNVGNESGQIRIGNNSLHTQGTVIASIYNFGATGGAPVYVTSGGRLGTNTASSQRYKEEIRDIATESDSLLKLRPVAFRYKEEFDPAGEPQYGLIAEEVAQAFPELVGCDRDGRPESVRYHQLSTLLLNEIQKQHRRIEAQQETIEKLESRLKELEDRPESETKD